MKKYILISLTILSNSVFAQSLTGVNMIPAKLPTSQPTSEPTNAQIASQASQITQGDVVSNIQKLNEAAVLADDPTIGLSDKDKEDYLNAVSKIKKSQEATKQLQELSNSDNNNNQNNNVVKNSNLSNQMNSQNNSIKKIEKTKLKDIYVNDLSGWNTTTIDEFTKQGKEEIQLKYSNFLNN